MALPERNTYMAHWRIVFSFTPATFLLYCFFHGLFVFSHMKLDRETFDHTMCEVNIKGKYCCKDSNGWKEVAGREVKADPKLDRRTRKTYEEKELQN